MGNNPSVSIKSEVISPFEGLPYLNHMLVTFRPSTTTFLNNFIASTQDWMFPSPTTNEGLVAQLTPNNWQSRLKSLGATSTEPLWRALDAHFKQLALADPTTGARIDFPLPDVVYVGRRTSAVVSSNTIRFSTNTAGRVRIRIDRAKYIYSGQDPAGSLADITVVADGVDTVTDLAADAVAQLNALADFAAVYTASNVAGVVTIVSDVVGFPLVVEVSPSTPGPTMVHTVTTANVANAYYDDLTEMQQAFETGSHLDPPARRAYWITDLQGDDVVNEEGATWVEDQADTAQFNPPRDYQFEAWSTTGDKVIFFGADRIGNFDPSATASSAQTFLAANANTGFTRAAVHDHDRFEFLVPALLGRCIGSLPGETSFTDKVLYGSTANSRMSQRDFGDNESLADDRRFNWYGAEGPFGSARYGYSPSETVGFIDRKWLEDYATYVATKALVQWKQLKQIVTYTDADIEAGVTIISAALSTLPAIISETIVVTFLGRAQVDPNNIALRIYTDYNAFAVSAGVINKIGTLADPINITIKDG